MHAHKTGEQITHLVVVRIDDEEVKMLKANAKQTPVGSVKELANIVVYAIESSKE